jgi:hypothetical protein
MDWMPKFDSPLEHNDFSLYHVRNRPRSHLIPYTVHIRVLYGDTYVLNMKLHVVPRFIMGRALMRRQQPVYSVGLKFRYEYDLMAIGVNPLPIMLVEEKP